MSKAHLSLRVDLLRPRGKFAWVIVELGGLDDEKEIAASLTTYDRPSQAISAGQKILATLPPQSPGPADPRTGD